MVYLWKFIDFYLLLKLWKKVGKNKCKNLSDEYVLIMLNNLLQMYFGGKIADKIPRTSRTVPSEAEHVEFKKLLEMQKERYISPEKRQH